MTWLQDILKRVFFASGRLLLALTSLVATVMLIEGFDQTLYRIRNKRWLFKESVEQSAPILFQRHPWLMVSPIPNLSITRGNITVSHNALGFRGKPFSMDKLVGQRRIVAYGGSTTYCTGVTDDDTWPEQLEHQLGPPYQVVNAGMPGYTTAEHIIQTALQSFDLSPDIAVYYLGWNDARNMHVKGLASDYSDFHGKSQLGFVPATVPFHNRSALLTRLHALCQRWSPCVPEMEHYRYTLNGKISREPDQRALAIYTYNLKTLVALCRARGILIILVPQVLNQSKLTADTSYGWLPFIKDRDVPRIMTLYNEAMINVCQTEGTVCLVSALSTAWQPSDFLDQGHFSSQGNQKFAALLAEAIRRVDVVKTSDRVQ